MYRFPKEPNTVLSGMQIKVGDKKIKANIEELERA